MVDLLLHHPILIFLIIASLVLIGLISYWLSKPRIGPYMNVIACKECGHIDRRSFFSPCSKCGAIDRKTMIVARPFVTFGPTGAYVVGWEKK